MHLSENHKCAARASLHKHTHARTHVHESAIHALRVCIILVRKIIYSSIHETIEKSAHLFFTLCILFHFYLSLKVIFPLNFFPVESNEHSQAHNVSMNIIIKAMSAHKKAFAPNKYNKNTVD